METIVTSRNHVQAKIDLGPWKNDHIAKMTDLEFRFILVEPTLAFPNRYGMPIFLEFEKPIEELHEQLEKLKEVNEKESSDKIKASIKEIEKKITKTRKDIYQGLTPWQRVQVSRHPERPYALSYIAALTEGDFVELHGDRGVKDDKAMIGGIGTIGEQRVMFVGQQKGVNTKMRQFRNFGMPNPEGYRKALRLMKLAEKFEIPVICLIDTPGAYPGLEAEERGQGEAIARNIFEMTQLKTPIICVIIGEGASGGALGIGAGDKVLMMENTWYSVISPESCSSILWRSWDYKEQAAAALKLTPQDMLKNGLVDGIIKEPNGGAHTNHKKAFDLVGKAILAELEPLVKASTSRMVERRMKKFFEMGEVEKSK